MVWIFPDWSYCPIFQHQFPFKAYTQQESLFNPSNLSSSNKKKTAKKVMRNIIYGTLAAGCLAYFMQLLKQPLILGYLLGGVLVGPIGLRLIIDEHEIATMSLGLHARWMDHEIAIEYSVYVNSLIFLQVLSWLIGNVCRIDPRSYIILHHLSILPVDCLEIWLSPPPMHIYTPNSK